MKKWVTLSLILMGFTFIITQVILIRETLIVFYGNELSIGVILANWLILEAIGSFIVGKWTNRLSCAHRFFAALQVLLSFLLPATIYAIRAIRDIYGIPMGEAVGIIPIFWGTFIILTPVALVDGAMFTVGSRAFSEFTQEHAPSIGKVYVIEAIGAIAGGLVFTYVIIQRLDSFQAAFVVASLNLLMALLLLSSSEEIKITLNIKRILVFILLIASIFSLIFFSKPINMQSIRRQWKGHEVLEYRNSIYGNITIIKREEQMTFFSDGIPTVNIPVPDITFVEEFSHFPLLFNPSAKRVLVISGGAGGVIREILKHPIERVDYTELDPLIIELLQKYPTDLTRIEFEDPRVRVKNVDGRLYVRTTRDKYDAIMVNLDSPMTLELNRFYTIEFFQQVRDIMSQDGIFITTVPGSETYMGEEMKNLNGAIYFSLLRIFPFIRIIPGDHNYFIASRNEQIMCITPDVLLKRLRERGLEVRLLNDFYIKYKMRQSRIDWFMSSLPPEKTIRINRDLVPSGLFYSLSLWNAQFYPRLGRVTEFLNRINFFHFFIPGAILFVIIILARKRNSKSIRLPVIAAVVTTGMMGMSFDIILILAFQSLYGYVYQWIGLLITAFMAGLTIGGIFMSKRVEKLKRPDIVILAVEIGAIVYISMSLVTLILLEKYVSYSYNSLPVQICILVLSTICGFIVGAEFSLSSRLYLAKGGEVSQAAGTLYAADLSGAFLGSLFTSLLLVPVIGILQTLTLLILLKILSITCILTSAISPFKSFIYNE